MNLQLPSAEWLLQLWPLALVGLWLGWYLRRGTQRRVDEQRRANDDAAARQGMSYRPPGGDGALVDEGVHRYGGRTDGIEWSAEVLKLAGQHHVDPDRTPHGRVPYIRWTAAACGTLDQGGGALALMNTPGGVPAAPTGTEGPGGWLGGLQARAGEVALKAWLALSFGPARVQSLSLAVAPANGHDADGAQALRIFTNRPALLNGLTPEARRWLMQARDAQLQVLWDDQGLTLMWPAIQGTPERIQACADDGATLARLLSGPVGPGAVPPAEPPT